MNLSTAISRATQHLLKSKKARTYTDGDKEYTLELEKSEVEPTWLEVTTWGYDYRAIHIPQTRGELIALKCQLQLYPGLPDGVDKVALRYYLDILRREAG